MLQLVILWGKRHVYYHEDIDYNLADIQSCILECVISWITPYYIMMQVEKCTTE